MKVVILFINIGSYHLARLKALQKLAQRENFQICAVQLTDSTLQHPWGDLENLESLPIYTLLPRSSPNYSDNAVFSKTTAQLTNLFLEEHRPDIVVIPGWGFKFCRSALRWCRKNQRKAILMSESKASDDTRWFWKEWIKSGLIKHFNAALVGGTLHKEYLVHLRMPSEKIALGYDVVDNDYFVNQTEYARANADKIRLDYPQIPQRPYFIVLTRFLPRKNLHRLLQAYEKYQQQVDENSVWHLVVCGSGSEEGSLKAYVQLHHLIDKVHFPGFISYQDIPAWYALGGAFIHPALQEQWGLVVNEAMAAGLPVLVSNRCGCFPELVLEGVNGFGFDPENIEQLTQLMLKMSSGDVDLYTMGQAALGHIQKYSPDYFTQGLKQAIEFCV
jgi:glycosyltransferase involved in cell wall biosynthesis